MKAEPFVSHASNHEDVVLARALCPDERLGFWIDVGAGHPVLDSLTAAFSQRGWRGINVEPLLPEFEKLGQERPDDININVALGEVSGRAKLHAGPPENRGSSTLLPELAERYRSRGQSFTTTEVEVSTLQAVVSEHVKGEVDFLKVDVEGFEREVLAGADWSEFRPRVIVVEATVPNTTLPSYEAWEQLVVGAGYDFALFDGLNRFYARHEEPDLREALSAPANVLDNYVSYHCHEAKQGWRAAVESGERGRAEVRKLQDRCAILEEELAQLRDDLGRAEVRGERAVAEMQRLRHELDAVYSTRTFRYVAPIRRFYARLRRRPS